MSNRSLKHDNESSKRLERRRSITPPDETGGAALPRPADIVEAANGETLEDLAHLLATGYLRFRLRLATGKPSDSSRLWHFQLDFVPHQSVSIESPHDGDSI
jgi:hypothetical protein